MHVHGEQVQTVAEGVAVVRRHEQSCMQDQAQSTNVWRTKHKAQSRCGEQSMRHEADVEVLADKAVVNISLLIQEGSVHSFDELVDIWANGFKHAEQAGCTLT